jgi:hypothetical protein
MKKWFNKLALVKFPFARNLWQTVSLPIPKAAGFVPSSLQEDKIVCENSVFKKSKTFQKITTGNRKIAEQTDHFIPR